jgi:hypothetical protein
MADHEANKPYKWVLGLTLAAYTGAAFYQTGNFGALFLGMRVFCPVCSISSICFFFIGSLLHNFILNTLFYGTLNSGFFLVVARLMWGIAHL